VSDSGVGFRLNESRASGGLGLVSMKERVRLVGGLFECWSEPNHGTIVTAVVPVPEPASHLEKNAMLRAE
jgi:signal transduction histidine kinase